MDIFDRIKELTPKELENAGILTPAKKSGYVCPDTLCGNGTGDDGTGLKEKEYGSQYNYHCFKCGGNFTAVDFIAARYGYNAKTKEGLSATATKAKEIFGLTDDNYSFVGNKKTTAAEDFDRVDAENRKVAALMDDDEHKKIAAQITRATIEKNKQIDYSNFYKTVQSQLVDIGENFRGLSFDDLREVNAGLATTEDLKAVGEGVPYFQKFLILPFNQKHFFIRQIKNNPEFKPVKRGNTGSHKELYNPYGVNFNKPVFFVEGTIDCLSIHKAGFDAVAADGLKWDLILPELERFKGNNPQIIVMFDNDDAGKDAAEKAVDGLKKAGFMAVNFLLFYQSEKLDANDYLQRDFDGFKKRLEVIRSLAEREFEKMECEILRKKLELESKETGLRLNDYFSYIGGSSPFDDDATLAAKFGNRETGFKNIDEYQIFLPGLYVIGGLSALGKTAFAWQLLEQLAQRGETCVYCSYEMSRLEMYSRLMSREIYRRESMNYTEVVNYALTPANIQRFNLEEHSHVFFGVMTKLGESKIDLRLLELSDETIDDLLKKLGKICTAETKTVTFCLDYLQIIPHGKDNVKAGIDDVVRKLKVFQRKYHVTFIVISSVNRQGYDKEISFDSFKESGNIEFTADVVFGLQLFFSENESRTNKLLTDQKKKAIPRLIELKCLKNRRGSNYSCYFKYLPHVDTFIACEQSEMKGDAATRTSVIQDDPDIDI